MIWCVEDDPSVRDIEVYALTSTGLEALGFEDGNTFWDALQKKQPDLVLLDVMLPGVDGLELLTRLKASERFRNLPVIMATAKGSEFDKVRSLDMGADDYITKPFGMMEMVSRVKVVLRRTQQVTRLLQRDELTVDLEQYTVCLAGQRIALTNKEFELLKLFLSQPGVVFTREQLLKKIWNTDYVAETRTVDMHIRTLRQKLGAYNVVGGRVDVRITKENGHVVLKVADTGIGIPPEHQSRIFERFYRVDKSHSKASGGTGLGLSIVKHAVQYHNAKLFLQSTPGKGTTITVTF